MLTFRIGLILDGPPLVQLNFFGMCMVRVSSGNAQACFVFVSEFDIESCSRSSSYNGKPPRAADARDIIPVNEYQRTSIAAVSVSLHYLTIFLARAIIDYR